jgi:hypothetical protein
VNYITKEGNGDLTTKVELIGIIKGKHEPNPFADLKMMRGSVDDDMLLCASVGRIVMNTDYSLVW